MAGSKDHTGARGDPRAIRHQRIPEASTFSIPGVRSQGSCHSRRVKRVDQSTMQTRRSGVLPCCEPVFVSVSRAEQTAKLSARLRRFQDGYESVI